MGGFNRGILVDGGILILFVYQHHMGAINILYSVWRLKGGGQRKIYLFMAIFNIRRSKPSEI